MLLLISHVYSLSNKIFSKMNTRPETYLIKKLIPGSALWPVNFFLTLFNLNILI